MRELGWHVVTIWACALKNIHARMWLEARLPSLIGPQPVAEEVFPTLKVAEDETPYRISS